MTDDAGLSKRIEDDVPTLDEVLPDDYVTPRPPSECDEQCPGCGHDVDSDDWDTRYLHGGASAGETWKYTYPSCGRETIEVST